MKKRVTHTVIAQQAGASVSLVSRILRGKVERHIVVSEEKILRVKQVAEKLEYCP